MSPSLETLRTNLLACPPRIAASERPSDVLDRLDEALGGCHKLRVLGAGRFPVKSGDWDRVRLGETAFRHKSVSADLWREYLTLARVSYDPLVMLARVSLAPFTWSEGQAMLDLVGADRWALDLCLKYGMRDGFTCPIGARWMVSFWSPQSLANVLSSETRAALYMAASYAAVRLEQLLGPGAGGVGDRANLTPRELAVLRWASLGRRIPDTARALGLGTETVRTHMRKAQEKLGARSSAHAVAEAMRLRFFP
jgi:DNA-binding CsgD family transcriptional regulator